jgi:hypothetical protein
MAARAAGDRGGSLATGTREMSQWRPAPRCGARRTAERAAVAEVRWIRNAGAAASHSSGRSRGAAAPPAPAASAAARFRCCAARQTAAAWGARGRREGRGGGRGGEVCCQAGAGTPCAGPPRSLFGAPPGPRPRTPAAARACGRPHLLAQPGVVGGGAGKGAHGAGVDRVAGHLEQQGRPEGDGEQHDVAALHEEGGCAGGGASGTGGRGL